MEEVEVPLPAEKLFVDPNRDGARRATVVLVATGSFNPPTYMHLRMFGKPQHFVNLLCQSSDVLPKNNLTMRATNVAVFSPPFDMFHLELAKDELQQRGYSVLGGYMSPVNDAYKKKGLLPAVHRIHFCELACKSSSFVMVDRWEAMQKGYQRTLSVLSRICNSLYKDGLAEQASLKVMLLCGSDLLESFSTPGVWIPDQVRTICKDFGVVCIRREGKDVEKLICNSEVLQECRDNIISVDEIVPNQISSSRVRECVRRCLSIKYLTCDEVIEYIREHKLYMEAEGSDRRS